MSLLFLLLACAVSPAADRQQLLESATLEGPPGLVACMAIRADDLQAECVSWMLVEGRLETPTACEDLSPEARWTSMCWLAAAERLPAPAGEGLRRCSLAGALETRCQELLWQRDVRGLLRRQLSVGALAAEAEQVLSPYLASPHSPENLEARFWDSLWRRWASAQPDYDPTACEGVSDALVQRCEQGVLAELKVQVSALVMGDAARAARLCAPELDLSQLRPEPRGPMVGGHPDALAAAGEALRPWCR